MMPDFSMSSIFSLLALKPKFPPRFFNSLMTTEPSAPALLTIWRVGSSRARTTIRAPIFSSLDMPDADFSTASIARRRATPPPGTMPSSTAALVACIASSTRAFFSFISVSVAAPTFTTATPPTSFARRSWSFSRS